MKTILIEVNEQGGFQMKTDLAEPFVIFFLELAKQNIVMNIIKPQSSIVGAPPGIDIKKMS